MNPAISDLVLSATGARSINRSTVIQSLWSGYGEIVRLQLEGGTHSSVILKHIKLPEAGNHPRGWNTDISHQRKVRSYQVEAHWYQEYASRCGNDCRVPECLAVTASEDETVLVLTDLDVAGFAVRKEQLSAERLDDVHACLDWLASFHATFMASGAAIENCADGLWECGTYWHLDTRPDELAALEDIALREAAPVIDQQLRQCRYQTLVHGDAKLANFCFSADSSDAPEPKVAAVDFQYVGRGCGMKDVAYFIGSCLSEEECSALERSLLDYYFSVLRQRLAEKQPSMNAADCENLETEWRDLYPLAWADFHRFLKGWSPGHWKINGYSEQLTRDVVASLQASLSFSPLSPQQLKELCDIAIQAAKEAGQFIQTVDRSDLKRDYKHAGSSEASQIVTEVDIRSEAIIRERLRDISDALDIAFVGEESSPSGACTDAENAERFQKPYFWCVDPLDGTLPFVEGRPGYAVSIALVEQSGTPLIGVVYDPVDSTLLHAIKGQRVYRDMNPFSGEKPKPNALVVYADASFKAHEKYQTAVAALNSCAQNLDLDGISLAYGAGAVKNACQVLNSETACYLKLPKPEEGGGSIWDFAASACIASEAGGWVSNIHGQALQLNRKDSTFMNHQGVLYASNAQIARYIIDAL